MHQAKTEDYHHMLIDSDNKTDQYIPDGMLKPLYSNNMHPESDVQSAIRQVEKNVNNNIRLPDDFSSKRTELPVVFLKRHNPSKDNFRLLQQWEGVVQEIQNDSFVCMLRDLSKNDPDETAEIFLDEISDNEKALISPGAVFYWNIGYYESKSGQRTRQSMIRFRRLPAWTKKEINSSKIAASKIINKLKWGINASNVQREKTG